MKTAEKGVRNKTEVFFALGVHKNLTLLWSVTAKAFAAPVCFNARRKLNLAWPYSLFCLFLRVLSCSQWGCSASFVSRASWGRGWSPTGWVTAHSAFAGGAFFSSGGTAATLTVLLPLPFALFLSWEFFFPWGFFFEDFFHLASR